MVKSKKVVKYIRSLSPLGETQENVFPENLFTPTHFLRFKENENLWKGEISRKIPAGKYDRSVALALSLITPPMNHSENSFLLASYSRGPTESLEKYFSNFLENGKVPPRTSPQTTLATLSNFLAEKLGLHSSPSFTLSATCASGLLGVWNAFHLLREINTSAFVFASEAPLTSFTTAQIKALRIYSSANREIPFPTTPLLDSPGNTFVLGEASAMLYLENTDRISVGDIFIENVGYYRKTEGTETSISEKAFLQAMSQAVGNRLLPDVVVTHAPGTVMGDRKELSAIQKLFPEAGITNLKWKIGHSFGASGLMNLVLGYHILKHQRFLSLPYLNFPEVSPPFHSVLVNAAGFGGHVVSVLLCRRT